MRTREDRQSMKQRRDRKEAGEGPDFSFEGLNNFITGAVDVVSNVVNPTPPPTPTTTPTTPTTPVVEDTPVVDPAQVELKRQAREVASGNVNPAQADYFRQQNEDLFMKAKSQKERIGANPSLAYNKAEKITGVNPVSNRNDNKMNQLFAGLYGSDESRGIL